MKELSSNAQKKSKVNIEPTRVFWELEEARARGVRIVLEQGSSRSGKTYNTTIWYCVYAHNNPNTSVLVVRSTMPVLKFTAFDDFMNVMRSLGLWDASRMNKQEMTYEFDNGSKVKFFATEDSGKAHGLPSDILFVNELTEIRKEVWDQLLIRCTTFAIGDFNPNFDDSHWIHKLIQQRDDALVKTYYFKTTYKDNPYLTPEQVAQIENLRYTDERMWRIYGLGEQALVEGLIFDNVGIVDKIPDYLFNKAVVGVDWGYTDPYAVTLVAIDDRKREVYMQEICYKSKMSDDEQLKVLLEPPCAGRLVVCDNAEPQLKRKFSNAGVRMMNTKKRTVGSKESIIPGIAVMKSYKLFITSDSVNGLTEQRNYIWKRDRSGNYTNEPIGTFNHFWDSVRYVVYTLGTGFSMKRRGIKIH